MRIVKGRNSCVATGYQNDEDII